MKTIKLESYKLDKRRIINCVQRKEPIRFETDSLFVTFSPYFISMGNNVYTTKQWTYFTPEQLRQLSKNEMMLWCKMGLNFKKLLQMYRDGDKK